MILSRLIPDVNSTKESNLGTTYYFKVFMLVELEVCSCTTILSLSLSYLMPCYVIFYKLETTLILKHMAKVFYK